MIYCITCETAHIFGNALAAQYKLRYRAFVQRQQYAVNSYKEMEYDQFDNPSVTYLVWKGNDGVVRGGSRLIPTNQPYMLKKLWPEMVQKIALPHSDSIWEGSRFCVDRDIDPILRKQIIRELVCAYLEYALDHNISSIIGVMPPLIWQKVFVDSGWEVEFIGEAKKFEVGGKVIAGMLKVSQETLNKVRKVVNIPHRVIIYGEDKMKKTWYHSAE